MLKCRLTTAELGSETVTVRAVRGFAQGGVLSSFLWNLLVDSLLSRLNRTGYPSLGFADDGNILIQGMHLPTVCSLMTSALRIVETWCGERNLSVNPGKTELMLFTRKRKIPQVRWPTFYGTQLQPTQEVKYLGIILDPKLTFKSHLDTRIRKATGILWQCRRTFGKTWGLSPKMVHWSYVSLVRPFLLYGAIVWWNRAQMETSKQKLSKLQRLAGVSITSAMRTTPTVALDILLNLPPLEALIATEARRSMYRIGTILGRRVEPSILTGINSGRILQTARPAPALIDTMTAKLIFERRFRCDIPMRTNWMENNTTESGPKSKVFYTDGSLIDGIAGAGVFLDGLHTEESFPLGKNTTVFQAEVFAIIQATCIAQQNGWSGQSIFIYSDSQAAIKAVQSRRVTSRLVEEAVSRLNKLGLNNRVVVAWVPGHSGIPGNDKADCLARDGSTTSFCGPEPCLGISYAGVKLDMNRELSQYHLRHWQNTGSSRQTKMFVKGPDANRTRLLLAMTRRELKNVVSIVTGHCPLNEHLHRIGVAASPTCEGCCEEYESAEHFLCECPAYIQIRLRTLGIHILNNSDLPKLNLAKVSSFIKSSNRLGDSSR